ncbi:FecR family protein [Parapedobacter deserti]|uniref:FecR family protein n=1 Tax=Parapedobacter deserti TaxID=1912957 RepID=A0ABV7JKL2_9SPHI
MDQHRIAYLHHRYLTDTLSPAEAREWQQLLADPMHEASIKSLMQATWSEVPLTEQADFPAKRATIIFNRMLPATRRTRLPVWLRVAAIFMACALVGYFVIDSRRGSNEQQVTQLDIQPGRNKAMLTLANGRTVDLSEAQAGIIVGDGITYLDGTSVLGAQDNKGRGKGSRPLSLATPKGGTYQVTLPDGTKVWLNSASTLNYPSQFDGDERVVMLEGEAYFEVSEQVTKIPFKVMTKSQEVEVLGTQFNIAAYEDEQETKTTLIEGRVRVKADPQVATMRKTPSATPNTRYVILSPGQQSITQNGHIEVNDVDTSAAVAWLNGRFSLDGKSLHQVMRELARWYDINVKYEGEVPDIRFFGGIHRNNKLSTVMNLLETNGIAYRLEADRTLILSSTKQQNRKEG